MGATSCGFSTVCDIIMCFGLKLRFSDKFISSTYNGGSAFILINLFAAFRDPRLAWKVCGLIVQRFEHVFMAITRGCKYDAYLIGLATTTSRGVSSAVVITY